MAKKYRKIGKDGNFIVKKLHYRDGSSTSRPDEIKRELGGLNPREYCLIRASGMGGGFFEELGVESSVCHLYIRSYYLHEGVSPYHQYDYELCEEVELFATADGKPVPFFLDLKGKNSSDKPKEVLTVAKGQKVVINVNQEVSLDNIVAGKDDFDIGTDGQTFSLTADKNMEIAITVSNYCSPRFKKTFYVRFQDKPLEEPSPK